MGKRGPPEGRSQRDRHGLKERAWELANGGMSTAAIAERLDVSVRTAQRWQRQIVPTGKEKVMDAVLLDIGDIRAKAYLATAEAEIDPTKRSERNHWWNLYLPLMLVVLRSALEDASGPSVAPQFIVNNLDQWYADLRSLRQLKPKLAQPDPEEEPPSGTVWSGKN